jgi:hypothetical protein
MYSMVVKNQFSQSSGVVSKVKGLTLALKIARLIGDKGQNIGQSMIP